MISRVHSVPRDENIPILHSKGKLDIAQDDNTGSKPRTFSSAKKPRKALGNLSNSQVNARQRDGGSSAVKEGMKFHIRTDVTASSSPIKIQAVSIDKKKEIVEEQYVLVHYAIYQRYIYH